MPIDASTYLVIQTERFEPHFPGGCKPSACGGSVTWSPVVEHVTWLSPSPENLTLVTLTPPTGFIKVPYSEMAQKYLGPVS
jgi:hypothetical protein